jgi:hypothetical protein
MTKQKLTEAEQKALERQFTTIERYRSNLENEQFAKRIRTSLYIFIFLVSLGTTLFSTSITTKIITGLFGLIGINGLIEELK